MSPTSRQERSRFKADSANDNMEIQSYLGRYHGYLRCLQGALTR